VLFIVHEVHINNNSVKHGYGWHLYPCGYLRGIGLL
jgi:hypothetical protein